jgi:putative peptidoglycan lipid II flippase
MVGMRMMAFSRSARLHAQGQREQVGELTQRAVTMVLLVVVPLVAWIIFSREELVRVLFERGRFDAAMSERVALVLLGMVPMVAFRCCNQLMSQAFYVLDRIGGIALLGPISTGFFLILIVVLAEPLGILGIALAGSFGFGFTFFAMLAMLARQFERFSALAVLTNLAAYTFAATASLWMARWLLAYLGAENLLMIIVPALVALPVYLLTLVALRNSAVKDLWTMVRESPRDEDARPGPA